MKSKESKAVERMRKFGQPNIPISYNNLLTFNPTTSLVTLVVAGQITSAEAIKVEQLFKREIPNNNVTNALEQITRLIAAVRAAPEQPPEQ